MVNKILTFEKYKNLMIIGRVVLVLSFKTEGRQVKLAEVKTELVANNRLTVS
jgi:hypothetical protein